MNITIQVIVPRQKTEGEILIENVQGWNDALKKLWAANIAYRLKNGNKLFANITTHEQYVAACEANERRLRREQGFWKYYFGA